MDPEANHKDDRGDRKEEGSQYTVEHVSGRNVAIGRGARAAAKREQRHREEEVEEPGAERPALFDLVFEGGGVKGVAYVGALQALADRGYGSGRLIGASIGSIFATLLAAGYRPEELRDLLFPPGSERLIFASVMNVTRSLTGEQLREGALARVLAEVDLPGIPDLIEGNVEGTLLALAAREPAIRRLFLFLEQGGIHDDAPFREWLVARLAAKSPGDGARAYGALNLAQFYEATGRSLTLIAADITTAKMLILNHNTAPACPLVSAVRMAAGVPPLFAPVTWAREWGLYAGENLEGHQVVDGALLSNFPIELFLAQNPAVLRIMDPPAQGAETLGLLLDDELAVPGLPEAYVPGWRQRAGQVPGVALLSLLLRTSLQARDRRFIEAHPWNVIHLPTQGIAYDAFDLDPALAQKIVSAGYNAVARFLDSGALAHMRAEAAASRQEADERATTILQFYGNINIDNVSGDGIAIGPGARVDLEDRS